VHYVESEQIASLSCWLVAAATTRAEDARSGSKSPMDSKVQPSTSVSACYHHMKGRKRDLQTHGPLSFPRQGHFHNILYPIAIYPPKDLGVEQMPSRQKAGNRLTPLELEIMQVLWRLIACNVQNVQDAFGGRLPYTTIQTMLNRHHRKGRVSRSLQGKAYKYLPVISHDRTLGKEFRVMVGRTFGGSVESLLKNLVNTRQIDAETLKRLARRIADSEKSDN
jgi:BlaI family transcriptional regulator, penicillinase repressor